jgi:hypothetical protein
MTIEIGSTYTRNDGKSVKIMGLAKCGRIDGLTIYWSLQGDWYAADGRFVYGDRLLPAASLHSINPTGGKSSE